MQSRFIIILFVFFFVDLYFYQSIVTVLKNSTISKKNIAFYSYWAFSVASYLLIITALIVGQHNIPKFVKVYVFAFFIIIAISKLIGVVFLLVDDIVRLFRFAFSYIPTNTGTHNIGRLKFISTISIAVAAVPFLSLIWGMLKGAYDYQVKKVKLSIKNLPPEFEGFKIVQISDLHTGSFSETTHLNKAFDMILHQNADAIFFTGDLVNDRADETIGFEETYKRLKAPHGVFSTLGNHDYGDYVQWDSPEHKMQNLENLKKVHANVGWKLLMNENHIIEKNGKKLAIIGIENWGANLRFPKYGKMKEAVVGTDDADVKLLLSHDPSHWEAEVQKDYPHIDVMFSGHTHGMQFGIEIPGFKWSPSQYFYKQWAGLYKNGNQQLYVNRGLGFLGYPGRVGILPEISVFELTKA
jgi:uncharacterized protein